MSTYSLPNFIITLSNTLAISLPLKKMRPGIKIYLSHILPPAHAVFAKSLVSDINEMKSY